MEHGLRKYYVWDPGLQQGGLLTVSSIRIQADKTPLYRKLEQHIRALTLCVGKLDPSKAYMCSAGRGGNMDQTQARTHTKLVPWQLLLFPPSWLRFDHPLCVSAPQAGS